MSNVHWPDFPDFLPEQLKGRYQSLAPVLAEMCTLRSVDADALGRYLLLSWEYSATIQQVVNAIQNGDAAESERWIAIQDRLHGQIMQLAEQFGLTPESRQKRGLILPKDR